MRILEYVCVEQNDGIRQWFMHIDAVTKNRSQLFLECDWGLFMRQMTNVSMEVVVIL